MNEQIYIDVVQAHFIGGYSIDEIVSMFRIDISKYRHQTHEGKIMFSSPKAAVQAIIDCEKQAHIQALNFE